MKKRIKSLYYDPPKSLPADRNWTQIYDWAIRVRVKKYELGGSFDILFFLSADSVVTFERSSPAYVGSYSAFVNSETETCGNCQNQADEGLMIQGFVPLNTKIDELLGLRASTFAPRVIQPYLSEMLKWKVEKVSVPVMQLL